MVPAYNEENGIEGVVRRLLGLGWQGPFELLVVNDGSSDGTKAVLDRLRAEFRQLHVIEHERNRGYGAALRTGFKPPNTRSWSSPTRTAPIPRIASANWCSSCAMVPT
ncbi:MAG: glycosyltransferase family 2 protein [Planctomycetota bacterium]